MDTNYDGGRSICQLEWHPATRLGRTVYRSGFLTKMRTPFKLNADGGKPTTTTRSGKTKAASIGIATTASLPWLTGASIAPLCHGVFLKKRGYETTLYVPWLPPSRQHHCFLQKRFATPEAQRRYIRRWLPGDLRRFCPAIRFYPSRYVSLVESIASRVNLDHLMDDHNVILLEGPEHLFGVHPWSRIKRHRRHVIGIVMTHYEYYHRQYIPRILARWYQNYSRFLMQRMCHRIVAIAAVQKDVYSLPMGQVAPVNAVMPQFFRPPPPRADGPCYFMGKLIPEKGLETMFRYLKAAGADDVDLFGYGETEWTERTAARYAVRPHFKGASYTPWEDLRGYRIFVNCSRSEYFCTTTANAIVMRQWAIVPRHPSNRFFYQFQNCLTYATLDEFVKRFHHARTHEPPDDPKIRRLSWEAATDRLIDIIEKGPEPCKR